MSKGSKQRRGKGYAHGYDRIWGVDPARAGADKTMVTLSYMRPIDKPEHITPNRLRFEANSVRYEGSPNTAILLGWCADLIESQAAAMDKLKGGKEG
jgi:hypothetical protein